MGGNAKREYLTAIGERYHQAGREEKGDILKEFCAVCHYHRKHAIRLLNAKGSMIRKRPGPRPVYRSAALLRALKRIWMATDQMCSKKLVAALPLWLPFYEGTYEKLSEEVTNQLLSISAATIDRLLAPIRAKAHPRGRCATKPGSLLRNQIPIRTHNWDISQPGFVEADTLAHCGNSLAGNFIWSLTLTDIHTGWTESRATWNNGATGVIQQIKNIEASLAFSLKGFDCDNGSEFLNHHLLRYFTNRKPKITFTRSRPYRKNDNAHVEQKNYSYVRQLLGYDRLDDPRLVSLINHLYAHQWSQYQNHFCPTLKLKEKQRLNSKYRKTYETPATPYQRLMLSPHLSKNAKKKLHATHQELDPFKLKQQIQKQLKEIFRWVTVTSKVRQRL
jgi:hypothetical protein